MACFEEGLLGAGLGLSPAQPDVPVADTIDPQTLSLDPSLASTGCPGHPLQAQQPHEQLVSEINDLEAFLPLIQWCNDNPMPATAMTDGASIAVARPSNTVCTTIDSITVVLGAELQAKTSPSRTGHASITMEIPASVDLEVHISAAQNKALEPLAKELSWTLTPARLEGKTTIRNVQVGDITSTQSQDQTVYKTVARRIVDAANRADGAAWLACEPSLGPDGWIHEYTCKHSYSNWKKTSKPFKQLHIAECSSKKLTRTAAARPAFDCRGSMIVSFSQRKRAIFVKYAHTLFHRTVGEVYQLLEPEALLDRPVSALKVNHRPTKAKSKPKPCRKPDATNPAGSASDQHQSTDQHLTNTDTCQFALATEPTSTGSNPTPDTNIQPAHPNTLHELTETATKALNMTTLAAKAPAAGSVTIHGSPVVVSPAEAARRRGVANKRLQEHGIDPSTLSSQQFSIFSNQAPAAQDASLAMLLKYGAEKLRIVQPTPQPQSASTPPTAAENSPAQTAKALPASGGTSPKKMGMSRAACFICKKRGTGCPKERPSCKKCISAGLTCEYPPVKPRIRKKLPAETKTSNAQNASTAEEQALKPVENSTAQTPETQRHSTVAIQSPAPQLPPSRLPDWDLPQVNIRTGAAAANAQKTRETQLQFFDRMQGMQQQQMHVTSQSYSAMEKPRNMDSAALYQRTPQVLPAQPESGHRGGGIFGDTSAQHHTSAYVDYGQQQVPSPHGPEYTFDSVAWHKWFQGQNNSTQDEAISYEPYSYGMAQSGSSQGLFQ